MEGPASRTTAAAHSLDVLLVRKRIHRLPGLVFVGAAVLAYGKLWGGALGWGASLVSISVTFFFFLGGGAATLMRLNLAVPNGTMMQAETYNKLFTLHRTTLYLLGLAASAYTALLLVEAVGLWNAKRWAEYLTFFELATLVPYETYEMALGVSALKIFTLVVNLAILIYLLIAHRLFGLRGGVRAAFSDALDAVLG